MSKEMTSLVQIRFTSITIEQLSDSSSVNQGINMIAGRKSCEQVNEGFGSINGDRNKTNGGINVQRSNDRDIR